jgi:hypothetical protein
MIGAAVLGMTAVAAGQSSIPYFQNFESGTTGFSGGSAATTSTSIPGNEVVYGRFRDEVARTLSLNTVAGQSYALIFDIVCFDSWDGDEVASGWGPDRFIVTGTNTTPATIFDRTLRTWDSSTFPGQTYVGFPEARWNFAYNSDFEDAVFRGVYAEFTATSSTVTLRFTANLVDSGQNPVDIDNESWGIDNVRVVALAQARQHRPRFNESGRHRGFAPDSWFGVDDAGSVLGGDLDGDGDMDAVMTGPNSFRMINSGPPFWTFTSSSFPASVRRGCALLDMDRDGDLDLFSVALSGNSSDERAFRNNGSGVFSSYTGHGLSSMNNNENLSVADLNQDGWPDLAVFSENGNWAAINAANATSPSFTPSNQTAWFPQTGTNVGNGDYASSSDANNDGKLDFFYHYNSGRLFWSQAAAQAYTSSSRGVSVLTDNSQKFGSAWGDFDNDGWPDLMVARRDGSSPGSTLWRNPGATGNFTNVTSSRGLSDSRPASSVAWGDIDNDGDLDLYVLSAEDGDPGRTWLNGGPPNYNFTSFESGANLFCEGIDASMHDFDNDGDLDLFLTTMDRRTLLYENNTNDSNYLKVRVVGAAGGGVWTDLIGARVELRSADGSTLLARREIGTSRGMGGQESLMAHFGLANIGGPNATYTVRVIIGGTSVSRTVVPSSASTVIGARTLAQTLTVQTGGGIQVRTWTQVNPGP